MIEKLIRHAIVWADIPVRDLERARRFYSAVMGAATYPVEAPGMRFDVLPQEGISVGGCLVESGETNAPSPAGPLVYINVDGRMTDAVAAVDAHGGQVIQPCHQIGEHGFRALVVDSEGNRIALHSHQPPS
ncbi:MAG: VOC family protein [Asticcacaulis sp.]